MRNSRVRKNRRCGVRRSIFEFVEVATTARHNPCILLEERLCFACRNCVFLDLKSGCRIRRQVDSLPQILEVTRLRVT